MIHKTFFIFLTLSLISYACASNEQISQSINENCDASSVFSNNDLTTISVDGVDRNFMMSVPTSEKGTLLPILMAFHGGDDVKSFTYPPFPQSKQFLELSQSEKFILVYPFSKLLEPNEGAWQLNTTEETQQDIKFIQAIIENISSSNCVDENKIYATGYSLGSMFTYELACHMSDTFAAIASFAGTMPKNPNSCVLENEIPIMHIHGTDDFIISYQNEWDWKNWDSVGTMKNIPDLVDYWSTKNQCSAYEETTGKFSTHFIYSDCDRDVKVEHYKLLGQGHGWPEQIEGASTHQVIWDFFKEF
ncbi:MAG: alpha/beta hydrolase family esterase [Dehalococcoidia bacterium]